MAFVATSAPSGWKLGRWSQVDQKTWREDKTDGSSAYTFQLINGPKSFDGSGTVRLKMKDQNTEVLLLDSSAQVFVNGSYFGEYGGTWEPGAGRKGSAGGGQRTASNTAAAAPARTGGSKQQAEQGAAFEQTALPQKSAPPAQQTQKVAPPVDGRKGSREPAAAPAPAAARPPAGAARQNFAPPPEMPTSPKKPEGLDKSPASMQKLMDACKTGDVKTVNEILASGVDPDGPGKDGNTPLMTAARGGHKAVIEALIAAFADPTLGKGEETPMTIAFQSGKQEILKVLFAASFGHLEKMVKPVCLASMPDAGIRSDNQEVPENAISELRDVTTILAHISKAERPESPGQHKKYGNYAHMHTHTDAEDAEKDSDMMREQSVRLAMKSLIKTANAEITGLDDFS